MKVYIKFFASLFFKSLLFVMSVMISLVFILNFLQELDFFQDIEVDNHFTIFLALLNSPSMILDMFPFIFLITSQVFFIKLLLHLLRSSLLDSTPLAVRMQILQQFYGVSLYGALMKTVRHENLHALLWVMQHFIQI